MSATVTTLPEPSKTSDVASLKSEGDAKEHAVEEDPERGDSNSPAPDDDQDDDNKQQDQDQDQQPQSDSGDDQSIRPARGVGKRPLLTHKDGKILSEKKLRRLEKNRLSARECRRRKREATENLQREINVLEAENLRLRLQLQIGDEAEENMKQEQAKLTEDIDELLKSGAPESEIYTALESFKEKHADYGRDRRSAIEFHLRNIERLLMPTQTTSIVMKAIQGVNPADDDDRSGSGGGATLNVPKNALDAATANSNANISATAIVDSSTATEESKDPSAALEPGSGSKNNNFAPKSLFEYLAKHLDVTPEQAGALKDSRFVAMEMDDCLAEALKVLSELRERMTQTGEDLETEFDNVRSILTPTQAAKFLVWVANNGAATGMLNELWERVYPAGTFPNNDDNENNEDARI